MSYKIIISLKYCSIALTICKINSIMQFNLVIKKPYLEFTNKKTWFVINEIVLNIILIECSENFKHVDTHMSLKNFIKYKSNFP